MISTRVLEILRMPDSIVADDITLLEKEIKSYPYVQSLRALYLLGVHKYYPESFQKVLSETAAYTTDKKILYQLINKKPLLPAPIPFVEEIEQVEELEVEVSSSPELTETVDVETIKADDNEELVIEEVETIERTPEEADGVEEVEQNAEFLSDDGTQIIPEEVEDISISEIVEETKEEVIINEVQALNNEEEDSQVVETEIVVIEPTADANVGIENAEIREEHPSDISQISPEEVELSFHAMDEFLPNVKIDAHHSSEYKISDSSQSQVSLLSPEEEMKKLIEAVEQKMKETKKVDVWEDETPDYLSQEINFAEGYLEPDPIDSKSVSNDDFDMEEKINEVSENNTESEKSNTWKPLVIESALPDALLNKESHKTSGHEISAEIKANDVLVEKEEIEISEQTIIEENTGDTIQKAEKEVFENVKPLPSPTLSEVPQFSRIISSVKPSDSNVPNFINTWQNWLKIDRVEPTVVDQDEKIVEEIKNQAIETFIENEPRISQLKDEVTFVVKEKSDDISHLMTETLARLYIEQKLYTKAIKSFKILIDKHPEKEAYFKEVIKEIKEMRPRF